VFGELVRAHRQRLGLSQEDLAGKAGVDPKTIGGIESGRRAPRPATVRRLADAFGLQGPDRERFSVSAAAQRVQPAAGGRPDVSPAAVMPAQLPPEVPCFVGRNRELDQLDQLLDQLPTGSGSAQPVTGISVISGTAGVGKTALALRWAHQVAHRFPDGQLYLNLRGFDPSGRVMPTGEALRTLLEGLGVSAEAIPVGIDAQIGRYRSQLAGKRMLIVLDNVRDAEQVRPLLPGTPTTLVVVTSRNQLTPLVARDSAHPLTLQLLSSVEAGQLIARRLGTDHLAADIDAAEAIEEIIAACARLPLALVIATARARQTGFSLTTIAEEMRDHSRRLDVLDAGEESSQIRSVFAWSYTALSEPAARLFRLLGLHPGPDFSLPAAASLSGWPRPETRRLLTELVRYNLVAEFRPGRYTFHDLLRTYAIDLTNDQDTESGRNAAIARLLDHYTHTAYTADRLLNPMREPSEVALDRLSADAIVECLTGDQEAMGWFNTEDASLLAIQQHAAETGFDLHAWQLAWATDTYLIRRGHRDALACTWQIALHAAHCLNHPVALAYAHRALARAYMELQQYDDARRHADEALNLYRRAGDKVGQAYTHRKIAYLHWRQGNPHDALRHAEHALGLFRAAGDQGGVANELNGVGWYHAELGNHAQALLYCQSALTLLQQMGDLIGTAYTWDSLGYAHHHLGHYTQAIECYHQALAMQRQIGDRRDQADTLARLGGTHQATNDTEAARAAWRQALEIFTELGLHEATVLRAKLRRLDLGAEASG